MNALSNSAASAAVSLRIFVVLSFVQMVLGVMATFATSQDVGLQTAAVVPGIALLVLVFRASEAFQRVPDGEGLTDQALRAGFRNLRLYFLVTITLVLLSGVGLAIGRM